ncbi:HIRAN domain-containing protein [Calditrichota bacterium LG25]
MTTRRDLLKRILALPLVGAALSKTLIAGVKEKEIFINQFSVAGFRFYEGEALLPQMKTGQVLQLQLDPENEYDKYAVKIFYKGRHIGFVPRSDNKHICRLLRQKVKLICRIAEIRLDEVPWQQLAVKVWIVTKT